MKKTYDKLVRDNIPEIIKKNNGIPLTRVLDETEYRQELIKKLDEEYKEVIKAETNENLLEELADMLEVIKAIAILEGKTLDDIIKIANEKALKRGGFQKRTFLEKVIEE